MKIYSTVQENKYPPDQESALLIDRMCRTDKWFKKNTFSTFLKLYCFLADFFQIKINVTVTVLQFSKIPLFSAYSTRELHVPKKQKKPLKFQEIFFLS